MQDLSLVNSNLEREADTRIQQEGDKLKKQLKFKVDCEGTFPPSPPASRPAFSTCQPSLHPPTFKEQEMENMARERSTTQRELEAERDKTRKRQRASDSSAQAEATAAIAQATAANAQVRGWEGKASIAKQ